MIYTTSGLSQRLERRHWITTILGGLAARQFFGQALTDSPVRFTNADGQTRKNVKSGKYAGGRAGEVRTEILSSHRIEFILAVLK